MKVRELMLTGFITGFEKAVDVGTPIIKQLGQEARDYTNSPEQLNTIQQIQNSEEL